jgi:hypothetical protein
MQVKSVADWMTERVCARRLIEASGLDRRIVEAIVQGRYTPVPSSGNAVEAVR